MKKKGQVTTFVIVGVVLLIIVVLALFARGFVFDNFKIQQLQISDFNDEIQPFVTHVQNCAQKSVDVADDFVAIKGGKYIVKNGVNLLGINIEYWYKQGEDVSPSIDDVEIEMANFIKNDFRDCIEFFRFEEQGFEFQKKELNVEVTLLENKIISEVDYPLVINYKEISQKMPKFVVESDSNLFSMFNVAKGSLNKMLQHPNFVDYNELFVEGYNLGLMQMQGAVVFSVNDQKNNTMVFAYEK